MALRLGLVQMAVGVNKMENLSKACQLIREAAKQGAKLITLPECFNTPYGTQYFKEYSEPVPGPTTQQLAAIAKECKVYLVGGSIPENDNGNIFNTCSVFSPSGDMIAKYRKMHLFDIDIPGKIKFQESEVLEPGNQFTTFDADGYRVGIGICYDMRFPDLAHIYSDMGCDLLLYPGAFNMTTGPKHWELLQRARALDNQLYVAAVSPARDVNASYCAWGYTSVVGPWGNVIASTEHEESTIFADIDHKEIQELRQNIPLTTQRRLNVYSRACPGKKSSEENPIVKKTADVSGYNIDVNQHVD